MVLMIINFLFQTHYIYAAKEYFRQLRTIPQIYPTIDALTHSLATAANDFLVASGPGVFVKKSLSETQTILVPKWSINEIPTGSINGVNMVFTLAHTPIDQIMLYLNGQYMTVGAGEDYTISGSTITMNSAPIVGDKIRSNYPY